MRISDLFTKTLRQAPKDETAESAKLLTRGGFIFKNRAGVYSILPLGERVLVKIRQIIREEMEAIGGQELHLNILQDPEVWKKTKRWEEAKEVMYRFSTAAGSEPDSGLGFTHEEVVAQIATLYIQSYKDLPKFVYQIQTKFRNEPRVQAGLLRGREFEMKDLYSLTATKEGLDEFYEQSALAYQKIFRRCGLTAIRTEASGGLFSPRSDEFQVLAEVGEDRIYVCQNCGHGVNKEIIGAERRQGSGDSQVLIEAAQDKCPKCASEDFKEERAIEVGNIFKLGTRFSEALGLYFTDQDGSRQPVVMGSYGIGTGRLMATVVEVYHDGQGIRWPASVAPFSAHLVAVTSDQSRVTSKADKLYNQLTKAGIQTLYDDREEASAGEKFADADLIGCPWRIVVSEKTGDNVELKERGSDTTQLVSLKALLATLKS